MTPADAARVLAKAAAFDARTIGHSDVAAWHEALDDLDVADALEAVTRHYRQTTDRLMPAHVRRLAAEIDRERRRAAREAAEAMQARALAAVPRRDRSAEVRDLLGTVRAALPPSNPDLLRRPEVVRWDRDRARHPHYDPAAVAGQLPTPSEVEDQPA